MLVFAGIPTFALALWGAATLLTLILLVRIIELHRYREYPRFSLYLAINLLQTVLGVALYQVYGFASAFTYRIAWTSQAVVVVARALAVTEVGYLVLGKYKGVWALATRVLAFCGLLSFGLALYAGRVSYQSSVTTLEIGLEACMATGLAGLFLFARYYRIGISPELALVGVGFGLFSCFRILNDLLYEHLAGAFGNAWNYGGSAAFVAVMLVWIWALRKPVAIPIHEPQLRPATVYARLIPQVNERLVALNEQLAQIWQVESPKS